MPEICAAMLQALNILIGEFFYFLAKPFHMLQNIPMFICNKLLKVIVDIGRMDWPMFYPDFFDGLLQLASTSDGKNGDTRVIGLVALRIVSEEFAAPREDVSAQRKEELKRLLLARVPTILDVVTGKTNGK